MKIGIAGWGVETQAAYRYFGPTHQYLICNEEPRDDFPDENDNLRLQYVDKTRAPGLVGNVKDLSYFDGLEDFELIVISTPARKNLEKKFPADSVFWQKMTTIQDIFFERSPSRNIIGVTGTKGKGTTSTLIAKMLEAGGKTVHLCGNIGLATIDVLPSVKADDWVVMELTSFQLYKFNKSPHIAVHLMMMPEHIDEWHLTMDDYVEAKRNIFAHQTATDIAVFLPTNKYSKQNVESSAGRHIPYTEPPGAYVDETGHITIGTQRIIDRAEVKLLGDHNLQNICAALTAVWQVHQDVDAISSVLSTFSGLEHRLQLAGEIDGAKYYDDSFGTTPDTAIVALDSFSSPKVAIIGGHDKGNPFEDLAKRLVRDDLRHIIFIGTTGQKILNLAKDFGLDESKTTIREDGNSWTMTEIIDTARQHAQRGDIVLLSTGCASFGLFKDYKDRGNQFAETVRDLAS